VPWITVSVSLIAWSFRPRKLCQLLLQEERERRITSERSMDV
jgi:hypothetical protein